MHEYLIQPCAPLVFRSGREFGSTGGGEGEDFPAPWAIAGALRAAFAPTLGGGAWSRKAQELLALECQGPLLATRPLAGGAPQALLHAPADALRVERGSQVRVEALAPADPKDQGHDTLDPALPRLARATTGGEPLDPHAFWPWPDLERWLLGVAPADSRASAGPVADIRAHISSQPGGKLARHGVLFQTPGRDFGPPREPKGWAGHEFALLARAARPVQAGLWRVGGAGRPAWIEAIEGDDRAWPVLADDLRDKLEAAVRLRLILATPAVFRGGWRPGWLDTQGEGCPPGTPGLHLKLRAFAVPGWRPLTGWSMQEERPGVPTGPRAARRAVPAGAVYWFEVVRGRLADHLDSLWLGSLCDAPEDRRDGFGLALPGLWNGT